MMKVTRAALLAAIFTSFVLTASTALAFDPLGFYVGAAVGRADVRDNEVVFYNPLGFAKHHMGWKLLVGMRPISLAGVELEYINFGHPSSSSVSLHADVQPKAAALFGVLYAPLPLPFLDIYAKAGVARLQTTVNATSTLVTPVCTVPFCTTTRPFSPYFRREQTDGRFAYGAGAQVKLSSLAIRAEYERITENSGAPDLLSMGFTWSF
jgi:opacity protein-like surface antigen